MGSKGLKGVLLINGADQAGTATIGSYTERYQRSDGCVKTIGLNALSCSCRTTTQRCREALEAGERVTMRVTIGFGGGLERKVVKLYGGRADRPKYMGLAVLAGEGI